MEALGDLLAPYSEHIAKLAGAVTTLQILSGFFLLNDIRKKKSSDEYPPEPFIVGLVLAVLTLKMGTLIGDSATITVNILGFALNVVFWTVFYWYASNESKMKIWSKTGIAVAFTVACLAYATFEDPKKIEFRFGMLITGILVFLVGSPLLRLNKIIEKKSTAGMPFPIIFTGTLVAACWALYAISIRNPMMAYQNLFLLVLSSIQLSLFAIYPNTPTNSDSKVTQSPSSLEHKGSNNKTSIPSTSSNDNKKLN
ncbi:PREDICTED: sugar transporter SWEET1-like [Rhagoletis zephyria]|uniref:sugar transporter SWEET1-like n=1 Tax=Rhagoletis zephyria TaxID=28612 RepID=UPI00081173CE|nr:PREDICTED: sugar transporter SWEET1-like [Rhagoletis zephyria]XP_017481672.1 PREDICTED: sugar transporter SWEET1-like [Rhagoletis zephyria]